METAACTLPVTYVKCAFCTAKKPLRRLRR